MGSLGRIVSAARRAASAHAALVGASRCRKPARGRSMRALPGSGPAVACSTTAPSLAPRASVLRPSIASVGSSRTGAFIERVGPPSAQRCPSSPRGRPAAVRAAVTVAPSNPAGPSCRVEGCGRCALVGMRELPFSFHGINKRLAPCLGTSIGTCFNELRRLLLMNLRSRSVAAARRTTGRDRPQRRAPTPWSPTPRMCLIGGRFRTPKGVSGGGVEAAGGRGLYFSHRV